jgi:hypothetical protein
MVTVDRRTRFDGDAVELTLVAFVEDRLPALLDEFGVEARRGAAQLGLPSLTFDVDGEELTLEVASDRLVTRRGSVSGALVVAIDGATFSDLMQDVVSTFGAQMTGRAEVRRGEVDDFVAWEPVLRCLLDGRPVYEPGTMTFLDRVGAPLDLHRSFTLDDSPEEIGEFLAEAGFLHLEGCVHRSGDACRLGRAG